MLAIANAAFVCWTEAEPFYSRDLLALATGLPIENWYTGNVTAMFSGATYFNQSLCVRNTSHVPNMIAMFCFATSFNGSLDGWDTRNVKTMIRMFYSAKNFNKPIAHWTFHPDLHDDNFLDLL